MEMLVPYEKELKFDTNVAEISSISLEYSCDVFDEEINGNFLITGEYKINKVSVNKEEFKFNIPFEIELSDNIIRDSIKHEINNFTYKLDGNILKVNIEFKFSGEEVVQAPDERDIKSNIDDILNMVELPSINSNKDNEVELEEVKDIKAEEKVEEKEEIKKEQISNTTENIKENIILNNAVNSENTYILYHIHIIKETDTVESICSKYNVTKDYLASYNDLSEFSIGSKLLIPEEENV